MAGLDQAFRKESDASQVRAARVRNEHRVGLSCLSERAEAAATVVQGALARLFSAFSG